MTVQRLEPGAAVVLSARSAAQIALCRRGILATWRDLGGVPAGLVEVLDELAEVARAARMDLGGSAAGSAAGSATVPTFDHRDAARESSYVTTRIAAERLGVTERAVVKALRAGRLPGRQRGGVGSRWLVDATALEAAS